MNLNSIAKLLVVAAHPDDDVLGCGGVIAKARRQGVSVRVLFLAEGITARYEPEQFSTAAVQSGIVQRIGFARAALGVLGVTEEAVFLPHYCGRLDTIPLIELGKAVEREISQFKPGLVLTHSQVDANNDHRLTLQAVLQATRPGAKNHVRHVLSFEVPSSTEWRFVEAFTPNVFVNIKDEFELKLEAIRQYPTEMRPFPFPRSEEGLRALAQYRGMQSGFFLAEAFTVVRSLVW